MKQKISVQFDGHYQDFYRKYLNGSLKKLGGDEYQGLCPFHEDKKASFSINAKNGVYYCHGCNEKGDAFHFYGKFHGLDVKPGFQEILKGIAGDFGIPWQQQGKKGNLQTIYNYTDPNDRLLFQVCRVEPKDFRQRRPDGNGGWVWDLKGVERVLYRLPDLAKSSEIFIVEGEKDADNLRKLGFVATCNSGGAGKWQDSYTQALIGKHCFIIPDRDGPGRKHADMVAMALWGKAKAVQVIELPDQIGSQPVKDVSDFIKAIGNPDEASNRLRIMAERTSKWSPPPNPEMAQNVTAKISSMQESAATSKCSCAKVIGWTAADLMQTKFPEPKWAVPGILPEGLTLLAGKPKRGKSLLALNLGIAISSGGKALGWSDVQGGTVLYLALEDHPRRLQGRLETMLCGAPASPRFLLFTQWPRMDDGGLEMLVSDAESHEDLRLVIIDTLPKFRPPRQRGVNDFDFDYAIGSQIKNFADRVGVAVLVICHLRKTQSEDRLDDVSGTFGVTGSADGVLLLQRDTGKQDGTLIVSGRDVEETEFALKFSGDLLSWNVLGHANEIKSTELKQRLFDAIRGYGAPFTPRQIAGAAELSEAYVKRMLPYLIREENVRKLSRGQYEFLSAR